MKITDNIGGMLKSTIVLFVTCLVITLAVAATNAAFEERIERQDADATAASMQKVIPAAGYTALLTDENGDAYVYEAVGENGETQGYIMLTEAGGYGGAVSVMTGVAGGTVVAVEILDVSNETPGLGQGADSEEFTVQFAGLAGAPNLVKSGALAENDIQALTGATITSKAVVAAVSEALSLYEEVA